MIITTPITISTIGEEIEHHLIEQTSESEEPLDQNGINFRTGPDDLLPGGEGTYLNGIHHTKLKQATSNTGVGLSVGDPNEPTHNGDYWHGEHIFLTGFQTSIHFHSMAMGRLWDALILHSPETPGDIGVRVTGGSSNAHLWQGLTIGNCTIGVSWETSGCGNVIMPGDMGGEMETAFDFYGGAHVTVFGGNSEAAISNSVFNVRTDATLIAIGVGGQGSRLTPAFDANDGTGIILRVGNAIGMSSGVMTVTGAGYGTTSAIQPGVLVDTQYNNASRKWKELTFPSIFRAALTIKLPADVDHYGAVAHVIRDSEGHGGIVRVSEDSLGNFFYDWLCTETP